MEPRVASASPGRIAESRVHRVAAARTPAGVRGFLPLLDRRWFAAAFGDWRVTGRGDAASAANVLAALDDPAQ